MTNAQIYAMKWGVALPKNPCFTDYVSLIEAICKRKNGYFIFKVDGGRSSGIYTFSIYCAHPADIVIRNDSDVFSEGVAKIVEELCRLDISP